MEVRTVDQVPVKGKRVLVRVDFNVSLAADNTIANDKRIEESLPTIRRLKDAGAIVVLFSHLGRPKGHDTHLSLAPVARRLSELLASEVLFRDRYLDEASALWFKKLAPGTVVLCENIRFHEGEEQNDPEFGKLLARLGDIFVNDAFGTAHRTHASTVGLASLLPSYAGHLLAREIATIGSAIRTPARPLVVIIGGGKTPEKIRVIERLLDVADTIYLGGAVANTFFATWGIGVGVSKVDHEMIEMARGVLWKATRVSAKLLLPADVIVSDAKRTTLPIVLPYDQVPMGLGIYDIGPKAEEELADIITRAKTIIWNGPMGLYEDERFAGGTRRTLERIARAKAVSIIGGGDTISTIEDKSVLSHISLISTGGSAMLEFIEKGTLPVIEALKNGAKKG